MTSAPVKTITPSSTNDDVPARVARLRSRRVRILAVVALLAVTLFVVLTLRLFVFPDLNAPAHSDAIVVLGGQTSKTSAEGVELAREGFAPTLALSVPPSTRCPYRLAEIPKVRLICFVAEPQTTQGEARSIARFAGPLHWRRIIVVMPVSQASRARLRIGRCYAGQILEVGVEPSGPWEWTKEIVYEWGATLKALILQPTC